MKSQYSELEYRTAALQSASPAQLVVILYDLLVGHLRKFAENIQNKDFEKQAQWIKRALLVLQQLEGSLDLENGGELAKSLSQYYSMLRSKLIEAQVAQKVEAVDELIALVINVRGAWQEVDQRNAKAMRATKPQFPPTPERHETSNWSA
jgi:flagellar secretion chaperone FliS